MPPPGTNTIITGDAVVLDVQIAQLPIRVLASLIDWFVITICYVFLVVFVLFGSLGFGALRFGGAFIVGAFFTVTVATLIGIPATIEATTRGRSLGKMALGLRVVSDDGGPVRLRQSLFRAFAGLIEIWLLMGIPAIWTSLLSSNGKRAGDMFAGTLVICERNPRAGAVPWMPPTLAWWASSLELSGVDTRLADQARQFLARAVQLRPAIRTEMAAGIANALISQVSPPPPPGTPPEPALAAVLAERHRRTLHRLQPAPIAPSPGATAVPHHPPSAAPNLGPPNGFALPN